MEAIIIKIIQCFIYILVNFATNKCVALDDSVFFKLVEIIG